ncbi:hypothetical protein OHA72_35340 [Dactylosporangium sp. NBC_01737]|uniref:hypothetical protein n=1 Tax=Dactylosporangium sp. NBC_01737 TaxID=2975959 RepID=UPI002E0DD48B|nr:hypothetical protein OHA72_35340 [Dactylosporangium sp. NBC_01737]
MKAPIVAVHGVNTLQSEPAPEAAAKLAEGWAEKLATGYRNAQLVRPAPPLAAAYYADLLDSQAQGVGELQILTPTEQEWAWQWLRALGVPEPDGQQGALSKPFRQALNWLSTRKGAPADMLSRIMTALLRETYVYLTRAGVRERCQQRVLDAIEQSGAKIVVAHSLGTVVTYEALCAHPEMRVDLLVTLGSPLGLPGSIFDALRPEPIDGRGARPAGVQRWLNIADEGDVVAVPARLGDKFPVDQHEELFLGILAYHAFDSYLSQSLVAAAIDTYL